MNIHDILPRFEKVRPSTSKKNEYTCRCPAHADKGPSLSIAEASDGRILMHCFAGCSVTDVCAAVGLSLDDLFPDKIEGHGSRARNAISAAQALKAISPELTVVLLAAMRIGNGSMVSKAEIDRVKQAYTAINNAMTLAGVS